MGKRHGRVLALGIVFWLALCGRATAAIRQGDTVPEFTLEKAGGASVHIPGDFRGKVVLLNFWASWCPECRVELPELARLAERYKGKPFTLLAVNIDTTRKAADGALKKLGLSLPVLYDTDQKVVEAFSPVGVPASYLIGPDGKVVTLYLGFGEFFLEKYTADIDEQLNKISLEERAAGQGSPKEPPARR